MAPTPATATQPGTRTDRLARLDADHLWHPFTPMRQWRDQNPIIIERAEGFELIDTEGNRYIDGFGSLWCNVHGHRVPEIDDAVRAQLDLVAHTTLLGYANVPSIELAQRLVAIAPGNLRARDTKVFYSDAGATSVELALEMATGYHYHRGDTKRTLFLGIRGAYHGDTTGSFSIGFSEAMHRAFRPMAFECAWSPAPDARKFGQPTNPGLWPNWDEARLDAARTGALNALDRLLDETQDRCAAIVVEPLVQGAAGIVTHPPGFLAGVERRARERGILLIADEVATGFGRTGAMFACDHESVTPDILCLAKGISGGYLPLAATICTGSIAGAFEGDLHEARTLYHGHTYTGNPLACAAALATLELMDRNATVNNANQLERVIRRRLHDELLEHPHVGDVRVRGMMTGIELVQSREPWTDFPSDSTIATRLCERIRASGSIIRPLGNTLVMNPAPAIDERTLGRLLDHITSAIKGFDFGHVSR